MQDERLPRPFGPYLLFELLGAGGAGAVYAARDKLARVLVIKMLHPAVASSPLQLNRFRHEAELAGKISHPNVIRVFDAGTINEQPFIAMEYVIGWSASELVRALSKTRRGLALPIAVSIVRQAVEGLSALHSLDLVHRDLSPNNIMIDEHGVVRLIDLGLAKSSLREWRTKTGTVMGSPGYMPPEQVVGDRVDHRADFYPLGVLLFEMVIGQRMLTGKTALELLTASLAHKHRPLTEYRPDVPLALDEVVRTATSFEPEQRFASCAAFLAKLDRACPDAAKPEALEECLTELLGDRSQERTEVQMKSQVADTFVTRPEEKRSIAPALIGLLAGMILGGGGVYAVMRPKEAPPIAAPIAEVQAILPPAPIIAVEQREEVEQPEVEKKKRAKPKEISGPTPPAPASPPPAPASPPPAAPRARSIEERKNVLLERASALYQQHPDDPIVLRTMKNLGMINRDSDPKKAEQTLLQAEKDLAGYRGG